LIFDALPELMDANQEERPAEGYDFKSASVSPKWEVLISLGLCAAVGASLVVAPGPEGLLGAFLAALMLAIAVTDAHRYIIPNQLTGAAIALAFVRASAVDAGINAVLLAAIRIVITTVPFLLLLVGYRRWRGRDGLGLGDIKLAAVAAAWLNLVTIFAVVELATLSALGAYVLRGIIQRRPLRTSAMLPFGLFLAPAIWIGWLIESWLNS